jgi:uncharacterized protein (TIGR03083 family)
MASDRDLHDAENADFSAYLHELEPADWERPSLCEGWRVRDVVGHILYGNGLALWTLPWRLARFGFSSDRSGRHYSIERAEGRTVDELLRDFDARDPWAGTGRVFPPRLVLLDRLVHHQDIRRALGHDRVIPTDRVRRVVEVTPSLGTVFRAKKRAKGLRFEVTDLDTEFGAAGAPVVRGPGEAVVMALLGRGQAVGDLDGEGVPTLAARCS